MEEKRAISSKGQVVVPKTIRDYLNLQEGDKLQFCVRESGEVVILPIKSENPLDLFGTLPPKDNTTADFNKVLYESKEERLLRRQKEGES